MKNLDIVQTGRIDELIRHQLIETKMATSLINDSMNAYNLSNKLIHIAHVLWIEDKEIRTLGVE